MHLSGHTIMKTDLNTSNVTIQHARKKILSLIVADLNTSNVTIQRVCIRLDVAAIEI